MATTIDGAWCLAQPTYPNGPYFLSTVNETYTLGVNVVTQGTTFVVANTGITLDLAGYSITYCDRSPVTIANGDFETTDFTGWDFTHAPSFSRVAASPFAHGSYMLQGTITTPEYFTTPAFTPTVYPYEYCAWCMEKGLNDGDSVKMEVIRSSDSVVLATSTRTLASRGFCVILQHKITTGDALKLRITCTPSGASTFWIDWIQYLFSRDYGIYCSRENYETTQSGQLNFIEGCPTQLYSTSGFTSRTLPSNFTLTDSTHTHSPLVPGTGLITSGAGKPREGFCFKSRWDTLTTIIDGVQMMATGIDSGCVYNNGQSPHYARQEITNSKLECDILAISDRMYTGFNVSKNAGSLLVEDCSLVNNPMCGIQFANGLGGQKSSIKRNTITMKGIVSQHYGVILGQVSNIDVFSNEITVVSGYSGRGILIDDLAGGIGSFQNVHIYDNDITVEEKQCLEYTITGQIVSGIRIRVYGNKGIFRNIEIDHNTINAETGQTDDHVHGAIGIRLWLQNPNGYGNNCGLFIHDNDITALSSRATASPYYYSSSAIAIDNLDAGCWPLFYNNDLESNDCSFRIGSYGDGYGTSPKDFYSESNTHIKSATYPGIFTYQSIGCGWYLAGTTRPVAGAFILDPKFSGGAPTTWTWVDSGWTAGQTGEILSGWIFTINGDVNGAAISVTDVIPTIRFTGSADSFGDLGYVPGPITKHVHTKGEGSGVDVDTTLTPLNVQYESSIQSVTPTANQTLNFTTLPPVRLVFVRKS